MIVNEFGSDEEYVLVDEDFVDVHVRRKFNRRRRGGAGRSGSKRTARYTVSFTFLFYGNFIKAILDGLSTFQFSITEKQNVQLDYLGKNRSEFGISNDIHTFQERIKDKLKQQDRKSTWFSKRYSCRRFLPDPTVSKISNKIITLKNYENHLPVKDVTFVDSDAPESQNLITANLGTGSMGSIIESAQTVAGNIFETASYDPAEISYVSYPAISGEDLISGRSSRRLNPRRRTIPAKDSINSTAPDDFYDLYNKFVSTFDVNTTLAQKAVRIKHKRFKVRVRLNLREDQYNRLIQKRSLYANFTFYKKGVPVQSESFRWNNSFEFEKLGGDYRELLMEVQPGSPGSVQNDFITISNPNRFRVNYSLYQCSFYNGVLRNRLIDTGFVRARGKKVVDKASTVFSSVTQSRSYRVVGTRPVVGGYTACDIDSIKSPLTARRPSYESSEPQMYATKVGKGVVQVELRAFPKDVDFVKIFRKEVKSKRLMPTTNPTGRQITSFKEKNMIGTLLNPGSILDQTPGLIHGTTHIYEANFYSFGAKLPLKVSTMCNIVEIYKDDLIDHINFSIADRQTTVNENSLMHKFSISESISANAATSFLDTVNADEQSTIYGAELEDIKTETGIVTRYNVVRFNSSKGTEETVDSNVEAGSFTYSLDENLNDRYRYVVSLIAAPIAAISYKTFVSTSDEASGKDYSYSYRKWRSIANKNNECLPSYAEYSKNNITHGLISSITSKSQVATFSATSAQPKVIRVDVSPDPFNRCNWITWNTRGYRSLINHFLIVASYNGVQAPVGCALPIRTRRGGYVFKESRLYGLLGKVTYQIILVRNDLEYDQSSDEVSLEKNSTYPEFAIL